ncbi:5'(3')-deoxyribonucleotidase [Terrimonas rubra]|uniref:5'(3')-deoxyribonucleotidase n=1 Tax=Terrimonas rubra TaxID=1035890 RepID=A0ABW6AA53_9BACT
MQKTIAVDMDGVLADVEAHALNLYYKQSGILLTKKDIEGRKEAEMLPDGLFYKLVREKGFFREVPVMPGAIEAIKKLSENFTIYIVSAAMEFPQSLPEKREWLAEYFPDISWRNIIFCGDKSVIKTDYMIDDHAKNLDFCQGKAIMFAAFHNQSQNQHLKFGNWDAVTAFFENE